MIDGITGGAGKLEFTLIGDTVNVAARVEQLTKTTGDAILLTQQSVDTLVARTPGLNDRGSHELKGKSGPYRFSPSRQGLLPVGDACGCFTPASPPASGGVSEPYPRRTGGALEAPEYTVLQGI